MEYVEFLRPDQLKMYSDWRSAPVGTILQTTLNNNPIVCLRIAYDVSNGRAETLMVISGDSAGLVFNGEDIKGPIIDVTTFIELGGTNPDAFYAGPVVNVPRGCIIKQEDTGDIFAIGRDKSTLLLHVCLGSSKYLFAVGYLNIDRRQSFGVSPRIGTRLKLRTEQERSS